MKRAFETLEEIGLKKQEIKVYFELLKIQEGQTGKICLKTGIPSSNIYRILETLFEKGLISYRMQNNIRIYTANSPQALDEVFKNKKKELEKKESKLKEAIKSLKKIKIQTPPQSRYKYYEGLTGIKSMWHEINERMQTKQVARYYTCKKDSYKNLVGFYTQHHKIREQKKIRAMMILPFEEKELHKMRKLIQIKYLDLNNEAEWGVIGDFYYTQYIQAKKPRAFLIEDKTFAQTYKQTFDQLWAVAKKARQ